MRIFHKADDYEAFERTIGPRTSLFIHCHPHNPIGHEWTRDELSRLAEICLKRDVLICSDEIWSDLTLEGCREAAVLVPLQWADGKWRVMLTLRTTTVEHHKGEISFPGGGRDPEDHDLLATALRETEEEVGIKPAEIEIFGRLDEIFTIPNYRVRPYVGRIPDAVSPRVEPDEIEELFFLPLSAFSTPGCFAETTIHRHGAPVPLYFFQVQGYTVWGATARIIKQFLEVCMDYIPPASPGPEVLAAMAEIYLRTTGGKRSGPSS